MRHYSLALFITAWRTGIDHLLKFFEPNPEESIETFLARLRAKYNPDQTLPTLLGGYVLAADGSLGSIKPTNKNIKF